jgi:hypothetical protein
MGRSVDEFFKDVEENSEEGKVLPNWYVSLMIGPSPNFKLGSRHGELYLEVRFSCWAV